ncbi:MAG: hypothetical protein ACR2H1_00315, partial [Limisphaerales bacterium]
YHLLKKKDGSLWSLDASEHRMIKPASNYKPIKLARIGLPNDMVAFAAGGDSIGVILTSDGKVWTWGKVIGLPPRSDFFVKTVEMMSQSKIFQPLARMMYRKDIVLDKPWQLSNR